MSEVDQSSTHVPETVLKRRKPREQVLAKRKDRLSERKQKTGTSARIRFTPAARFVRDYRNKERSGTKLRRQAKLLKFKQSVRTKKSVLEDQHLVFIIRLKGTREADDQTSNILQSLRLKKHHVGVFAKYDASLAKMLHLVQPYITYGTPTLKTVRDLLLKRGFCQIKGERRRLENLLIEQKFQQDILCVEDLVHEIYTLGRRFEDVNNFLAPFQLASPGKIKHEKGEKGGVGDRGDDINDLIKMMI